jgi:hypothetical protein
MAEEFTLVTQAKPTAIRASTLPERMPGCKNVLISFLTADDPKWKRQISLFGTSCLIRKLERKPNITQCNKCYSYHSERSCIRASRCVTCASTMHTSEDHPQKSCTAADPHTCPPRCTNCLGPHPATAPECPLRPTRRNGAIVRPGKEQVKAIKLDEGKRMAKAASTCIRPKNKDLQQTNPLAVNDTTPMLVEHGITTPTPGAQSSTAVSTPSTL